MKTDIQIARETKPEHIRLVAEKLGIMEEELEYYGKYKAKLSDDLWERVKDNKDGKLVLYLELDLPDPLPDVKPEGGSSSGFDATVEDWGDEIEHEIEM